MKTSFLILASLAVATGCSDSGTGGAGGGTSATSTASSGSTTSTASSGSTTTTSTTTSSSTGGFVAPGECETNSDCPPDGACVEFVPGGYRVCQYPVVDATMCNAPGSDECCSDADCTTPGDKCILSPFGGSCGGAQIEPHNQCAHDLCTKNSDCNADEVCGLPGALGYEVRVCIHAACMSAICGQKDISPCAVIKNPCCSAPEGLYCATGCLTDADCPGGYCDVDPNNPAGTSCHSGTPICPG